MFSSNGHSKFCVVRSPHRRKQRRYNEAPPEAGLQPAPFLSYLNVTIMKGSLLLACATITMHCFCLSIPHSAGKKGCLEE